MLNGIFEGAEVISVYTRKQAVEDGVLVDVSDLAKEAGIRFPLAMTSEAYAETVRWTQNSAMQDETGRLWDVLWMLKNAIKRSKPGESVIFFNVYCVPNKPRCRRPVTVELKAICGPGDNAEPTITVLMPWES